MTNEQIEKFLEAKNVVDHPVRISFKTRKPFTGIFIKTADYSELKSKNFWRIVGESNIKDYKKSKDVKLARIFSGGEITKLAAAEKLEVLDEPFILEVDHNGRQVQLETRLLRLGYTFKFAVVVDETEIFFERDEEGGFRAVVPEGTDENSRRRIDPSLLQSIAETIQSGLA